MYEHLGEKRSVAAWAKKLGIPIKELLHELESGKSMGQIESAYCAVLLPVAA